MLLVLNNWAQDAILTLTWAWVSHFKVLCQSFLCDGRGTDRRAILYKDRYCLVLILMQSMNSLSKSGICFNVMFFYYIGSAFYFCLLYIGSASAFGQPLYILG